MARLRIRVHRTAALVVGSLLSSNAIAASAPAKVVILQCAPFGATGVGSGVVSCDRSIGVVTNCPAALTSCAQALAVFESAPDNLQLINGGNFYGANTGLSTSFWYTLSSKTSTDSNTSTGLGR